MPRKGERTPSNAWVEGHPVTLEQAHREMHRTRPRSGAADADWLAYHTEAERIYGRVADTDPDHHFEALAFAAMAREDATKFGGAAGVGCDQARVPAEAATPD